jgi:hypothetical protein
VSRFILRLLDVMRLRSGPQDMPGGWSIAVLICLIYLSQGFFADRVLAETNSAPRSLIAVSIQFLVTGLLLRFRHLNDRLPQTLTTLAGTGIIFGAISIFLVLQVQSEHFQPALALVWFAAFLWSLTVDGYIYRHALSTTMSMGMLVAVLIFALNFFAIEFIFAA